MKLYTDEDLAEMLGISVADVRAKCVHEWPCVRPKRSVWRFTEAQVEEIIAIASQRSARGQHGGLPKPTARGAAIRRGRR